MWTLKATRSTIAATSLEPDSSSEEDEDSVFRRMYFDPFLITATRRHATVYARYQQLYVLMDSAAAIAFIVGSVFFLDPGKKTAGEWLFLVGSVLFAFVPMITIAQDVHLGKLRSTGK